MNTAPTTNPSPLHTVLLLRWGTAAAHLIVLLAVRFGLGLTFPLGPALALIIFDVLANLSLTVWARDRRELPTSAIGLVVSLDIGLLTLLLHVTGGPYNPFSLLYLLHLAIASLSLSTRWAVANTVLALAAYGALFSLSNDHSGHHAHGAHSGAALRLHLEGMWYAFATTAAFMVPVIHQLRVQLDREAALRQRQARMASLATLAAGAAHELSTPLSTIALAARELERTLEQAAADPALTSDAKLICEQVIRCRTILEQLGQDAGSPAGEPDAETLIPALVRAAILGAELDPAAVTLDIRAPLQTECVMVAPRTLRRALRGLLRNAADAAHSSGAPLAITVTVRLDGPLLQITVADRSGGMVAGAAYRAGEPFFSTKETGRGMGLGIFLARSLCEQRGGALTLTDQPGVGVTIQMTLAAPLAPDDEEPEP
jgi:two-component system sensor histidine kinase RegB